jgi:maltose alpha-D-glucosyltransferase/alpha-amylase
VVVKLIRHLTAGIHPELEIGRILTARGYQNAPMILGDMTRVAEDGTPHTLIVLQRFIHSQGDAWRWTLDTLARTAQQSDDTESEAPEMSDMADPIVDLLQFAGKLGTRLAELHAVLAQPTDDPAFAPERATTDDCAHLAQQVKQQLEKALSALPSGDDRDDDIVRMTMQLRTQQAELEKLIDRLAAGATGALRIRIHGDFHLGQVLVSSGDVYLLDFEGEPARTLEERREKNSPWRDVAGLLRSYDYAAYFSANSGPSDLGETALARRQKILQRYVPESRDAFLAAYRDAAPDAVAADALLDLFTLEKATYEICYEVANRPTWLPVPLRGLTELAARLLPPHSDSKKADDA